MICLSGGPAVAYLAHRVPSQDHPADTLPSVSVAALLVASPTVPVHPMLFPAMLQAMTVLPLS